jgi:hypothetical protein
MPSAKTKTRLPTVASLLLGSIIGFGGRMAIDRLRKTNSSDTHAAKTSVFDALQNPSDTVMLGDSLTHWGEWSELFPVKEFLTVASPETRSKTFFLALIPSTKSVQKPSF